MPLLLGVLLAMACQAPPAEPAARRPLPIDSLAQYALAQYTAATRSLTDTTRLPRNNHPDGTWNQTGIKNWTSGFFPGVLWYLYALTGDEAIATQARRWTRPLYPLEHFAGHHDIGFMLYNSVGNELHFTDAADARSAEILVHAARALVTRFDPQVGLIRSWDHGDWQYPVIIDNMMNLELLMWAFQQTGDSTFYQVAIDHADKTIAQHFRPDYSTWHVVDYDTLTGEPVAKVTHQGYADDSQWARGHAWAIYGYTMMYRETGLPAYRDIAQKAADYFIGRLPADVVPFWDFDDPDIPQVPKDASAAAITASALLELSTLVEAGGDAYRQTAEDLLHALSTADYLAQPPYQCVLLHSTGHLPGDSEVDVHIIYADYYYLEALYRLRRLQAGQALPR